MSDAEERSVRPYEKYLDTVMTNLDHSIDYDVAEQLKKEEAIAQYSGWDFCGYVWWSREHERWMCEVWQYHSPIEVVEAETLEEIMSEVCSKYGDR